MYPSIADQWEIEAFTQGCQIRAHAQICTCECTLHACTCTGTTGAPGRSMSNIVGYWCIYLWEIFFRLCFCGEADTCMHTAKIELLLRKCIICTYTCVHVHVSVEGFELISKASSPPVSFEPSPTFCLRSWQCYVVSIVLHTCMNNFMKCPMIMATVGLGWVGTKMYLLVPAYWNNNCHKRNCIIYKSLKWKPYQQ